jgi:hypothetical protein
MITIKCQVGKNVIEVSADTAKKAIEEVAFFQDIPSTCPVCDEPVRFTFRSPKNFTYYGVECTGPDHHASNFGQAKEGGTIYYKHAEKWVGWKERQNATD